MANTRLTANQLSRLNNFNVAAQKSQLGTRLDTMEYGGLSAPAAGTLSPLSYMKYSIAPVLGTATKIHADITMPDTSTTTVTTLITNPDVPRVCSAKGNASGIDGNVVLTGLDFGGTSRTDTITLNGTGEIAGAIAFKTITQIVIPAKHNASGDKVSIGVKDILGLPVAVPNANLVIAASFDGAVDAGSVTAAATIRGSLYTPAGTLDGAKIVDIYLLV